MIGKVQSGMTGKVHDKGSSLKLLTYSQDGCNLDQREMFKCESELLDHPETNPHLLFPMDLLSPQLLLYQHVPASISYSIYPPLQQ